MVNFSHCHNPIEKITNFFFVVLCSQTTRFLYGSKSIEISSLYKDYKGKINLSQNIRVVSVVENVGRKILWKSTQDTTGLHVSNITVIITRIAADRNNTQTQYMSQHQDTSSDSSTQAPGSSENE